MVRACDPAASQAATVAATWSGGPDTTVDEGLFSAATTTWWARSPSSARSVAAVSRSTPSEAIAPWPASARRAWERSATTRAASSRERAPAAQAAAISPWEWPTTAAGRTPWWAQTAASAVIMAHSAGCTTSTRPMSATPGSPRSTWVSDQSVQGASARSQSAIAAAKTGEVSSSSAPMPSHCDPCPGNTSTGPGPSEPAVPVTSPGEGSPAARASRPARSAAGSRPATTARCSNSARVVSSDRPTALRSWSPPAARPPSRRACSRRAASLRADRIQGTTRADSPGRAAGPGASGSGASGSSGACSRIRWALVPENPNADTPARRGRWCRGHATGSVSSRTAPAPQSTCGVGSLMCSERGNSPCRMAITILITPATPAAIWVCPRLDLTDPSHSGRSAGRS
ncbi:hypothetical protein ACZ90_68820 [Streptomyces albus subsp. albus]|nr:hypothetical protein ACZ90_68820 [Streptomyces albus subsp. albus]